MHSAMKGMTGTCHVVQLAPEECCCDSGFSGHRHFYTAAERKEHLEKYREQLEKELEGVRERITELSS